jgi:hypothetical protein
MVTGFQRVAPPDGGPRIDPEPSRRSTMKRLISPALVLAVALALPSGRALAQRETTNGVEIDKDIALLRKNIRSEKKQILAANLPLSDTEATKFWPVYDQYVAEMTKHNDDFYALIKEYAAQQKTITDAQAIDVIKRWSDIQLEMINTRRKYIPLVEKVLPGRKAALFFQIDRRLYELLDLQITSEIPLLTH